MKYGSASPSGSKASGIDELPYALELEPLNREDVSGKLKMRSLSGNNPPWKIITRYPLLCSASLLCFAMCKTMLPWLPLATYEEYQTRSFLDHILAVCAGSILSII